MTQKSRIEGTVKRYAVAEWLAEGRRRFGDDQSAWRFVCPSCGHVASVADYKVAGAPEGAVAFSCVGRFLPKREDAFQPGKGPCNYAGGGLFRVNPVTVVRDDGAESYVFDFADCAETAQRA